MKKTHIMLTSLLAIVIVLSACSDDSHLANHNVNNEQQADKNQPAENDTVNAEEGEPESDSADTTPSQNQNTDASESQTNNTNHSSDHNQDNTLSIYTTQEIEYARVWLQLGDNQELDTLYAQQIPAGEPLNPDDETSLGYLEDVIQLSGERLLDGVITYSSNGDGTVNVYNVPKRWDGKNPAGEDFYQSLIDDTMQQSIDPGEDKQVEALIQKLEIEE